MVLLTIFEQENQWKLQDTFPPRNDFIFQSKASLSGEYAEVPIDVCTWGVDASAGTGNSISTFVAVLQS